MASIHKPFATDEVGRVVNPAGEARAGRFGMREKVCAQTCVTSKTLLVEVAGVQWR